MPARTFTNQDGGSNKFWTIAVDGAEHTVHYGRVGTAGQVKTKAFADAAKAAAAAEKLIAEKLAKGYAEDGASPGRPEPESGGGLRGRLRGLTSRLAGGPEEQSETPAPSEHAASPTGTASSSSAATPAAPKRRPAKPAAAAAAGPSPLPDAPRAGIDLRADQWALATWRPLAEAPGLPRVFDPAAAAATIKQAKSLDYGWSLQWREWPFEGPLTAQEAGAWLQVVASKRRDGQVVAAVAKEMAAYTGSPPAADEAYELAVDTMLPDSLALAALVDLLGAEHVAEWLLASKAGLQPRHREEPRAGLVLGVRAHLLPRLEPADRERFAEGVRDLVAQAVWPTDYYQTAYPFQLAAQVGLHAELQATVDAWPDGLYRGDEWHDHYHRPQSVVFGLGSPELVREAFERLGLKIVAGWHVAGWLAHTETSALDFLADRLARIPNRDDAEAAIGVMAHVHDPAAAYPMLELMRTSRAPSVARDWLAAHPLEVQIGLGASLSTRARPEVVDFLRARKRTGEDMAAALPFLEDATRYRELVVDYADPASRELTAEEVDPALRVALDAAPAKKLPKWLDATALPPVVPGGDGRLSDADVDALLRLLAAGERFPGGLGDVEAFGWALFEAWLAEGAPSKDKWAFLALGALGGDATATRLAPLIRAWPGESQHARAVLGLGVLGEIGTDTALMLLSGIAEKVKFKALQTRAREAMDEIATAKGMTKAELEDRIVPTCDLDERGSRTFDYGPRQFTFVLGPGMKPMVRDEAGKIRASPPKPGAKDDDALAAKAQADWKLLRKQVGDVAKIQAARLEQAMVTQRRWSTAEFERFIVQHPLQRHLARLLLWRDGAATFRVTDELDYADVADEPVELRGEIGLVHPLQLSAADRAAWGEVFADYEIVPPFPQLGRPVLDIEPGDRKEKAITRFAERKLGASTLVRMLENLGWHRGNAYDNGIFMVHAKPFPSLQVTAVVQYDGVPMGYMVDWEDQAIEQVFVVEGLLSIDAIGWGTYDNHKLPLRKWGDVDPIVRSEVLADIAAVLEKAR